MKSFNFSLQKVLEYKERLEDNEKAILAQMRHNYDQLCREMDVLSQEYECLKTKHTQMCASGVMIQEVAITKSYMEEIKKKMDGLLFQIKKAKAEIERQVNKIIEIAKDKNIIEKLKEKHYTTYQELQKKETEIFIDDFISNIKHTAVR